MDHKLAETSQAVERYTLDEMSPAERVQFEEHLFDCSICAESVRQTFSVTENLIEVLREDAAKSFRAASTERLPSSRRNWFDWRMWGPSLAAIVLACIVVVQQRELAAPEQARILPPTVITPVSRGAGSVIQVEKNARFLVASFMVDASAPNSYSCDFINSSGRRILSLATGPEATTAFSLPVVLPSTIFPAGTYEMRLHPISDPAGTTTYRFTVETEN